MAKAQPLTPGVTNPPKPSPSPLQVVDYEGASLGMITAVAKHEIPDGGAAYLQDVILDQPGIIRERGPVTGVSSMVSFTRPLYGAFSTYSPASAFKVAVLESDGTSAFISVLSDDHLSKTSIPWPMPSFSIVASAPFVGGGVLISTATGYEETASQLCALWRGGTKVDYTEPNSVTATFGSASLTGTSTHFTANVSPGMFVIVGNTYVGCVKSVNSDTSITLEQGATDGLTGSNVFLFTSLRRVEPFSTTGEITVAAGSTTVVGQNTKFAKQSLAAGPGAMDIYRLRDYAFVGQVSSVTNDTSLTLTSGAAIAMNVDRYVAIPSGSGYQIGSPSSHPHPLGFISATYSGRQFYANLNKPGLSSTLWFSEEGIPESVDYSVEDGDFIPVSSGSDKSAQSPIKALAPGFHSLLIIKDDETFVLTGAEPEQFQVDKVFGDGCLSGMSVTNWQDTVIWAGRNGIYAWDGTQVKDLAAPTLGKEYKTAIASFDPTQNWMKATVIRDHYILYIENVTPAIAVKKGNSSATPSAWTVVINLLTGALSLWTNVELRGAVTLPANEQNEVWYVITDHSGVGRVCDGKALFDSTGPDAINTVSRPGTVNNGQLPLVFQWGSPVETVPAGPNFYMESKRYALGDPLRRKLIKQIALWYMSQSDGLTVDTITGLGDANLVTTNTTSFPALSSFDRKRYKFLKHDNLFGFRLYATSADSTAIQIGPWQFGFKVQAPGRI